MNIYLVFGDVAALEHYATDVELFYAATDEETAKKKRAELISSEKEDLANWFSSKMKDAIEADFSNAKIVLAAGYGLVDKKDRKYIHISGWLQTCFYSNIKIKEIADSLFVSENYLIEEYKKVYGKTPLQDLNSKRIDIIKNLLKNTDMRISDISRKLSFNSEHYFSTFFKKYTGMTPTKYRNMFKQ